MPKLTTTQTFSDGDQVTSAKLNNIIANASFGADAVDNVSTELNGSGNIVVKSVGTSRIAALAVTPTQLATGAVVKDKIGTGAVTETKIDTGAVTETKIGSGAVTPAKLSQPFTLATAQSPVSVSSVDFTGIPSWVKRITIIFDRLAFSSSSDPGIQIGDSGGIENTGYESTSSQVASGTASTSSSVSYFLIRNTATSAPVFSGHAQLTNSTGNTWVFSATGRISTTATFFSGGQKTLSGTLDRLRILTDPVENFTSGSVNIIYEG